jgi:hypothetical protein
MTSVMRAGLQIKRVHVMPLRVAVIEADQHSVAVCDRSTDDQNPRVLERSQAVLRARYDVDAVEQEILVAALVLHIQKRAAVGCPKILLDRPRLLRSHRPRVGGIV